MSKESQYYNLTFVLHLLENIPSMHKYKHLNTSNGLNSVSKTVNGINTIIIRY